MDGRSSDGGPGEQGDAPAKRGAARDSLFLLARLRVGDEPDEVEVRVRNLSERGLMAESERPLEPGTAVSVDLRGIGRVGGRVAWYAEGRAGVALDEAIDPMAARKPVAPPRRPVPPAPAPRRR